MGSDFIRYGLKVTAKVEFIYCIIRVSFLFFFFFSREKRGKKGGGEGKKRKKKEFHFLNNHVERQKRMQLLMEITPQHLQ